MTIAEKILAKHSDRERVRPGEYIWARVTRTGITGPPRRADVLGVDAVFDRDRVWAVDDHNSPAPTIAAAAQANKLRRFVRGTGLTHYFEHGRHGIQHQLFPEHGFVAPGDLIASVDSHSTSYGCFNAMGVPISEESTFVVALGELWFRVPESIRFELVGELDPWCVGKDIALHIAGRFGTDVALYRAVEFGGPVASQLSLGSRFTLSNMSAELGAKCGIFEADEKTLAYLRPRVKRPLIPVAADPDASYEAIYEVDVSNLEPQVALPHDPGNLAGISEVAARKIPIHQAFLGSCTNGRVEDIAVAARLLKGRTVHPDVRMIVTPASSTVWSDCAELGYWKTMADAGVVVTSTGCGACIGGHMGVLGPGDVCISSGSRNFRGRMGSQEAEIYLSSPAVVAASAIQGHVADPRELV